MKFYSFMKLSKTISRKHSNGMQRRNAERVTSSCLEELSSAVIGGWHLLSLLWGLVDRVIGHLISAIHGHVRHRVVHRVHGHIIGVGVVITIGVALVAREKLSSTVIGGWHLLSLLWGLGDRVIGHLISAIHGHVSLGSVCHGRQVASGSADEVIDLVDSRLQGGVRLVDDLGGLVDRLVRDLGNLVLGIRGSVLGLIDNAGNAVLETLQLKELPPA